MPIGISTEKPRKLESSHNLSNSEFAQKSATTQPNRRPWGGRISPQLRWQDFRETDQQNHPPPTKKPRRKLTLRQGFGSSGGGTRTPDTRITIQHATPENPDEIGYFREGAAQGAAVGAESGRIDADLERIIDAWPGLPEVIKAGVRAMVDAAGK